MAVSVPTRTASATHELTVKDVERYFSTFPVWAVVVAAIGALFFLLGVSNLNQLGFCAGLGIVLLAVGGIPLGMRMTSPTITDQQYDDWVIARGVQLREYGKQKVGLVDPSQIKGEVLSIQGMILPTTDTVGRYTIKTKQGKDGITRFSINTFKFYYPAEHNLAAFSDIVDALHPGVHLEKTEEFFYDSIVGAKTEDTSVTLVTKVSNNRAAATITTTSKTFYLISSSGSTTGDTVGIAYKGNGVNYNRPATTVDRTVDSLRKLLQEKKGAGQRAQEDFQRQQAQMQQSMQAQMLEMQQKMLEQMGRMNQGGSASETASQQSTDGTIDPNTNQS